MKNRLRFRMTFEIADIHNDWDENSEEWDDLANEIYHALEETEATINVPLKDGCGTDVSCVIKAKLYPVLIDNKE